jgi:transcription elongation factor GreA
MEVKPVLLTAEGLAKLEAELAELTGVRRREIAHRIRLAREFGEIAENAEYIEAKNEQSLLEGRIQTLEGLIFHASLIDPNDHPRGVIDVGAEVRVQSEEGEETYTIVGAAEADPLAGRISNESPLGMALLGHRAGEEVEWESPIGYSRVKIVSVR